jgi:hypothetical protein
MQCINCGRPLRPGETICPNCGEPVLVGAPTPPGYADSQEGATWAPRSQPDAGGLPIDPYAPTVYGPPAGGEHYGLSYPDVAVPPTEPLPWQAYQRSRPPRRSRGGWLAGVAAIAVLCVVSLLAVGALIASGAGLLSAFPLGLGHSGATPAPRATTAPAAPTATAVPACPSPAVDLGAVGALANAQLTTGLRDPQHLDYRPVDDVTTFKVGQYFYVTAQVATNQPGQIAATICINGVSFSKVLNVPPHYQGAHAEFSLGEPTPVLLASSDVGRGDVVLRWNQAVAAVLPFTVVAG